MENTSYIKIYVTLKHMGNIAKGEDRIKKYPFLLEKTPQTLRELITESVRTCIRAYISRADNSALPSPINDEEWEGMREIGKFAFGVHYNENTINEARAIETALEAFSDGLVRVFKGNHEITAPDEKTEISEGDVFTFIRLTMLSGRMW